MISTVRRPTTPDKASQDAENPTLLPSAGRGLLRPLDVDLRRSMTGDGCCASGPNVAWAIYPRVLRAVGATQEPLRHPYMQWVSALTG